MMADTSFYVNKSPENYIHDTQIKQISSVWPVQIWEWYLMSVGIITMQNNSVPEQSSEAHQNFVNFLSVIFSCW